jgi:excinuclease ABC subunit A
MDPYLTDAAEGVGRDDFIVVVRARTHNLRDVSVRIPKGCLVAFTGVSGSGKTSLAIDTLHTEAQLRYLEGLSPFVRQYIPQRTRPRVDQILGLTATLAVDQRRANHNPRSTVATITGINSHLGLLYSRLPELRGKGDAPVLTAAHFDHHSAEGACPSCHGVGGEWKSAPDLIVTQPERPLFDGASPWFATWHSTEHNFVPALAEKRGVDLELPWRELPESFRHEVMWGTGSEVIEANFTAKTRSKTGYWSFTDSQPMIGAVAEVERVLANASTPKAKQRYRAYVRKTPCSECGGSGYGPAARSITLGGYTYQELVELEVKHVREWTLAVTEDLDDAQRDVGEPLLVALTARLDLLMRLGVGHVQLGRSAGSLSGGEAQRTRLAAQLATDLTGLIFVLDEPGAGLHPADKAHLLDITLGLCKAGNTVLLVEHDPELIARADWVVDMGPGAGSEGGRVVVSGPPAEVAASAESVTGRYLRPQPGGRAARTQRVPDDRTSWLELRGVQVNNVAVDTVRIPRGHLVCLTGVSGSGKSSLLRDAIGGDVKRMLDGEPAQHTDAIVGAEELGWVTVIDQEPIGRTPRSNPATYTKAFDAIRKLFAATDRAREIGANASSFSFNANKGRCPACEGYGQKLVNMHFLPDIWVVCDVCEGRRFTPEILTVTYRGMTISDVLELSIAEAVDVFDEPRQLAETLQALQRVGLGYMRLGQSATELSGGEAQRLKLAAAIQRGGRGNSNGLVVMDEPVSGLHPADVQKIIDAFDVLLAAGTSVVIAEHDLHVAAWSDWLIDLGPGAGSEGGRVVAEGPPGQVAAGEGSTAAYLSQVMAGRPLF